MRRPPRVHFSFRSPFSWMTVELLRREVSEAMDQIDFIPFWDPDEATSRGLAERGGTFHYAQMSKAKHLYILQDTKRIAQRHGFPMVWPVDIDPWWEVPHLAWLQARRIGLAEPFYDALIRARWHRGEDICRTDAVRAAAEEAGADPDLLAAAVDSASIRDEAVACLFAAWRDDIFGIPYMRVGRHRFWGLDRLDEFLDAYFSLRNEKRGHPVSKENPAAPVSEPGTVQAAAHLTDPSRAQGATGPLDGIPRAARDRTGGFDKDTAGGCG